MDIQTIVACGNLVGESPVWCNRTNSLYWVDIAGKRIFRWSEDDNSVTVWSPPEMPTSIGLRSDGGAILGLKRRLVLWDFAASYRTLAIPEPDADGNRLNEGKVGPDGHYWVGTMQNNIDDRGGAAPIRGKHGRLYRVSSNGKIESVAPHYFGIPNGFVWMDDRFVASDTTENLTFIYSRTSVGIGTREPFGKRLALGLPDGACVDAEGYVWSCRIGASAVVRFSPDGEVTRILHLPCSQPTSCVFGGREMRTLFITTARFGLPEEQVAAAPIEGALLAMNPGTSGRPDFRFG
jgi:sugar lactone lactonase YvrE